MPDVVRNRSVPQIIVSNADYERLTDLANASLQRQPAVARELLDEMDRANVVDAAAVPADVVRMGSTVTFVRRRPHAHPEARLSGRREPRRTSHLGDDTGRCRADRLGRRPVDLLDGARRQGPSPDGNESGVTTVAT